MMAIETGIIAQGRGWVALNKPPGMLVEQNPWEPDNLEQLLHAYLSKTTKKPFVGIVHRLDRVTGGIVLMATGKQALKELNEQFREKTVKKTYRAIVEGVPTVASATLRHWIVADTRQKKAVVYRQEKEGSKEAILHYRVLDSKDGRSLLDITLETGRFHQIRAQLAAIGHPVVGDLKYGAEKSLPDGNILLQAVALSFTDPYSGEPIAIVLPDPLGL